MTRWTHNGEPVGPPQRPWRLTRAQRVEMEAALGVLRVRCAGEALMLALESCGIGGLVWLRRVGIDGDAYTDAMLARRRILRARLAIALRAALRADEDARCEEADARFIDDETETLREMCEWPAMRRRWTYVRLRKEEIAALPLSVWTWANGSCDDSRRSRSVYAVRIDEPIPLALWEVDERRRRETVRAVVALLTWGLS